MSESGYYLVWDWTGKDTNEEPDATIVYGSEAVFKIVSKAKEENRKIAVYAIGKCLLDWS